MYEVEFKRKIATHLKMLRTEKKLSLDAAAKLTGVSKAMLGQIEREESSPTISKLWKIASGLETSFSAFFGENKESDFQEHFPNDPYMKVKAIFPYDKAVNYEIYEIILIDNHCQISQSHAHGVIESIVVIEGDMEIFSDGKWHPIKEKEKFRFYADQPHGYKAVSERVVFQNIVSY